eukprot:326695-Rhodomonas_salina.1
MRRGNGKQWGDAARVRRSTGGGGRLGGREKDLKKEDSERGRQGGHVESSRMEQLGRKDCGVSEE